MSPKPSACSACSTAWPCGSSSVARGITRTSTRNALMLRPPDRRGHAADAAAPGAVGFGHALHVADHDRSRDVGLLGRILTFEEAEDGRAQYAVTHVGDPQREE